MNRDDIRRAGLAEGDVVSVRNAGMELSHYSLEGLTVVGYDIPTGCCATYYPEANALIPLEHHDTSSSTPGYKSVPVRVAARCRKP